MTRARLNIPCTSLLRQFSLLDTLEWETFGIDNNVTLLDASFWSLEDIRHFMPHSAAFALTVYNFIQRCKGIRNYAKFMYFPISLCTHFALN